MKYCSATLVIAGLISIVPVVKSDDSSVELLRSVRRETNSAAAREAGRKLAADGAVNLLPVLKGLQGASALGGNWLRSVFETIASQETRAGRMLPADVLTKFIQGTGNAPAARRLAYEWLLRQDPALEHNLIPGLLEDDHPDFRRDAVALLIDRAKSSQGDAATQLYKAALRGAVHDDQVTVIAEALEAAGQPVNLQQHFGFLSKWNIIGPFENREMKGYATTYPPEVTLDPDAAYAGQLARVSWQTISSDDSYGLVDIAQQIKNYKGSLMYAATTFHSPDKRRAEFRLGTPNAWKMWVNSNLVFEREEYHRTTRMDQYRVPVALQAGENTIMLKVCQNEQEENSAQKYQFQLRVVDSSGAAVLSSGSTDE